MSRPVSPRDHAFANGPVFSRVATKAEAVAAVSGPNGYSDQDADDLLAVWRQFDEGAVVGDGVKLGLGARLINLGPRENVVIDGPSAIRGILRAEAGGTLRVGRFVYVGDGAIVSARSSISIGESTLLAHGVQVFDNNSHPTSTFERVIQFRRMLGDKRLAAPLNIDAAPVNIAPRCWIGLNSLVLKGVSIGEDTIVAAASVVSRSLEAGVVAAGNPAQVVRVLTAEERAMPAGA
jgi:acetyltransferase-like isoleucine patch superfamily enzyme